MTKEEIALWTSIGILLIILLFVILFFVIKKVKGKTKKKKSEINSEYIEEIVVKLGGKPNISNIDVVETKLKIAVNDLKLVDLEGLKALTSSGVFVTANTIKILFKYDSKELKDELNRYKGV